MQLHNFSATALSPIASAREARGGEHVEMGSGPVMSIATLVDAWHPSADGDEPDWTRFRALADHLHLQVADVPAAIGATPASSGSERVDNLLAAIAEKIADDHGLARPHWTAGVQPLREPWRSSGTPRMREREASEAPAQFLARGIELAADNVWRRRP